MSEGPRIPPGAAGKGMGLPDQREYQRNALHRQQQQQDIDMNNARQRMMASSGPMHEYARQRDPQQHDRRNPQNALPRTQQAEMGRIPEGVMVPPGSMMYEYVHRAPPPALSFPPPPPLPSHTYRRNTEERQDRNSAAMRHAELRSVSAYHQPPQSHEPYPTATASFHPDDERLRNRLATTMAQENRMNAGAHSVHPRREVQYNTMQYGRQDGSRHVTMHSQQREVNERQARYGTDMRPIVSASMTQDQRNRGPSTFQAFAVTPHNPPEPVLRERLGDVASPRAQADPSYQSRRHAMIAASSRGQPVHSMIGDGNAAASSPLQTPSLQAIRQPPPPTFQRPVQSPLQRPGQPTPSRPSHPQVSPNLATTSHMSTGGNNSGDEGQSHTRIGLVPSPGMIPITAPGGLRINHKAVAAPSPIPPQASTRTQSVSVSTLTKVTPIEDPHHRPGTGPSARIRAPGAPSTGAGGNVDDRIQPNRVGEGGNNNNEEENGRGEQEEGQEEAAPGQPGGRQLRVEDALAYLEQVKNHYGNKPHVYNNFLDIMKDFKAKVINTNEVIRRVSALFQNNEDLILGFNTFLPPGFRIELRKDSVTGRNITGYLAPGLRFVSLEAPVVKSEPIQVKTEDVGAPKEEPRPIGQPSLEHLADPAPPPAPRPVYAVPPDGVPQRMVSVYPAADGVSQQQQHRQDASHRPPALFRVQPVPPRERSRGPHPSLNAAAATLAGGMSPRAESRPQRRLPVTDSSVVASQPKPVQMDFDRAVNYVNHIKERFEHDPNIYKSFLEVLQRYQRETDSAEMVHERVKKLFQGHDDLLEEFRDFLPVDPQQPQPILARRGEPRPIVMQQRHPQLGGPPVHVDSVRTDYHPPGYLADSDRNGARDARGGNGVSRGRTGSGGATRAGGAGPSRRRARPRKPSNGQYMQGSGSTSAELEFFAELRRILELYGLHSYSEIMKCVMLFTREIISGDELIKMFDELLPPLVTRKALLNVFSSFVFHATPATLPAATEELRSIRERELRSISLTGLQGAARTAGRGRMAEPPRGPLVNPAYSGKRLADISAEYGTALEDSKSYLRVPDDAGKILSSGMTEGDRAVLNHEVVVCGPIGESMLGKRKRVPKEEQEASLAKNYEAEGLKKNKVDDDRYRIEVSLANAEGTLELLRPYVEGKVSGTLNLKPVDVQPLEMIYASLAPDMLESLRRYPNVIAKIVYDRLEKRVKQWKYAKENLETLWKSARFCNVETVGDAPNGWSRLELLYDMEGVNAKKTRELFKSNNNQNYVMDLFWYVLEWETESMACAKTASETFRKLYCGLEKDGALLYCDKYLYVIARLAAAVTERADYVLLHNYNGTAHAKFTESLKDLLGGRITATEYEKACLRLFGAGRRWEVLLTDFPVVLGRLVRTCLKLADREISMKLLEVHDVFLEDGSEDREEKYRRTAFDIARNNDKFMVEIRGKVEKGKTKAIYKFAKASEGENASWETKYEKTEEDAEKNNTNETDTEKQAKGGVDKDEKPLEDDVEMIETGQDENDESKDNEKEKGGNGDKKKTDTEAEKKKGISIEKEWSELTFSRVPESKMTSFVEVDQDEMNNTDDELSTRFTSYVRRRAKNSKTQKQDVVMADDLKPIYVGDSKKLMFAKGGESSLYRKRRGVHKKTKGSGKKTKSSVRFSRWLDRRVRMTLVGS